ncbi:hypothetical protein PVNG_06330, partial [Plasmodium vivax North Korean]
ILCSLIPIVGLTFPALFYGYDEENKVSSFFCAHPIHESQNRDCTLTRLSKETLEHLDVANHFNRIIFYFILPTIYFSMIIYGFIKVVKYERIKSGKGKMSFKEYCRFSKDLF